MEPAKRKECRRPSSARSVAATERNSSTTPICLIQHPARERCADRNGRRSQVASVDDFCRPADRNSLAVSPLLQARGWLRTPVSKKGGSEKWSYIDERDLQGWKADCVCMTCQHFAFGTDPHSFTLLGCNIRQKQLRQGDHLNKRCQLWAPTWQKEMGWEPWL